MSQEQIEHLLLTQNVKPNKLLGQNFMVETSLYSKLAEYAALCLSDVVLDAGAGFGFLTTFLSQRCKYVFAIEKDPRLASFLRERFRSMTNVNVMEGDVLKSKLPLFNKAIAIPPYYLSSHLVVWLLERNVDCAVLILQKEFVKRIIASVGSEEYGWLTVVTKLQAKVDVLDSVPKTMFYPSPEVDSTILRLKPCRSQAFQVSDHDSFLRLTKWLFTQRNKKLAKALAPYLRINYRLSKECAEKLTNNLTQRERRVRELAPKDFGAIADALPS